MGLDPDVRFVPTRWVADGDSLRPAPAADALRIDDGVLTPPGEPLSVA